MSYPNRPPMGMPQFIHGMPMGIPPPMGIGGPPPMGFFTGAPPGNMNMRPPSNQPPPNSRSQNQPHRVSRANNGVIIANPTNLTSDHPLPMPSPSGPPVTVFVGNITERWPDAMIRQLLATCGQVFNWRRVQGASGKLQGFGFCEFNGPDAGLRAVRLLHDLEVGDKKLVVKVDAKTSTVLDKFKADKKKIKDEKGNNIDNTAEQNRKDKELEDYMDKEMLESDARSKLRIDIIFREFKSELDQYMPVGSEKPQIDKDQGGKHGIQDKLHLLKLSSLDPTPNDDPPEDIEVEEGKREIISQEIGRFREYMKQEKEKEDERKKIGRERREREREREERGRKVDGSPGRRNDMSPILIGSPVRRRSRDRSPRRDRDRRRSRDRDLDRVIRDRDRDMGMRNRDRDQVNRRRSRERRSISKPRDRDRSPLLMSKPKYREREEEEETRDQKIQERKAREKEMAYEDKLRLWEKREAKKAKDVKMENDRQRRMEEDVEKDAKKMKQFLEDYDDEKHDPKYYKGKEFQKRLAERAKELESDNRDRQREREELEEMRLRVLTTGGTPTAALFEKYKKTTVEPIQAPALHLASSIRLERAKKAPVAFPTGSTVNSRLLQIAGQPHNQLSQNNAVSLALHQLQQPTPVTIQGHSPSPIVQKLPEHTKSTLIPYKSPSPVNNRSNSTTPNSFNSPAMSSSVKSLTGTGFQLSNNNSNNSKKDDDESRQSFSDGNSPGGASPMNYSRDDDSSLQDMSPDFPKKKKIDIHEIFNQDEDENDALGSGRKRKLVPLDYGDEGKKLRKDEKSQEDKKKHIKTLIDKIPTEKDALFTYVIDWEMVDNALMERRIRPWINKKIVEYIGEPEPTLVDFICTKVLAQSQPQSILDDVMQVLDEEAEVFVVKMWRLLVYEIEAKKYGIAAKS